jgi:hypothetical protein
MPHFSCATRGSVALRSTSGTPAKTDGTAVAESGNECGIRETPSAGAFA